MPAYPTELRHGSNGYRRGATTGLSGGGTIPVETAFLAPAAGPLAQYGHGLAVGETAAEQATLRAWLSRFPIVARAPLGVVAGGFLAGWELGAYFLGREDLSLIPWGMLTTGTDPVPNAEPSRWSHPRWQWFPCATPTNKPAPIKYRITNGNERVCGFTSGVETSILFDDPKTAQEAITTHNLSVQVFNNGGTGTGFRLKGEYAPVGAADPSHEWLFDGQPLTSVTPGFFAPAEPWTVSPEDLPIMQPVTNPVPKPWADAVADPATQPSVDNPVETKVGDVVQPFVMPPFPTTFPSPIVVVPDYVPVTGGVAPVIAPDVVIQPSPDGGLDVIQVPPGTTLPPEPAGPGKKERKITVRTAVGPGVHGALNVVTESLDFVDTLYKGIQEVVPREQWCSNHDYACKLAQLYEHWDDPNFDAAKWVSAFINNQFEDAVFGIIGQQVGRATGNLGITTGLNRALGEGQEWASDLDGDGVPDGPGALPELTIDEEGLHFDWEIMGIEIDFET